LQPEEALLAAHAARVVGDRDSELRHLRRAAEGGPLVDVARIELAEAVVAADPSEAIALSVEFLRGAPTRAMRQAAVDVMVRAMGAAAGGAEAARVEQSMRYLPTDLRRSLELALARTDSARGRQRLVRLLEGSTADLVALDAARTLQAFGELAPKERWLVAESLFQHALYDEALVLLVELDGISDRDVPSWEVAFTAGRCAFRHGRWDEAVARYRVAASRTRSAERRAELEVHQARAHELAGRLDEAADCAVRAVSSRPSDDRRLFLARLRLRLGQTERAAAGVARLRGGSARARGELLLALADIRAGRSDSATRRLTNISRRPWAGPAAVLAAGLAVEAGDLERAIQLIDGAAADLDPFWGDRARAIMERLPPPLVDSWRARCAGQAEAGDVRSSRRALARWATLEIDPVVLASLRERVGVLAGMSGEIPAPAFPDGLADRLWRLGLRSSAVRWDPGGLPAETAPAALWTAQQLVALGVPWRGLRAADTAWRIAGADVPARGYPETLQRALHPLPYPEATWRGAVENAVPWTVVAGVAREESRWQAEVLSAVGARGLMQLMPSTAAAVAARIGRPVPSLGELFDPEVSLELGAAELGRLFGSFSGDLAAVAAAYNAGEPQARIWLDQCGEGCSTERFVANITFRATSRYAEDVLASAASYAELYGPRPQVAPASSQTRGLDVAPRGLSGGGSESPRSARPQIPATARSRR
jgi:soluble lytic murein transglycosylase-like protein/tetratricopeptide (TPR) repeat protein